MAKKNPSDDLLKSLASKTERQMRDIFKKSTVSSTDELQLLYVNARDNAIGRYAQDLKDIARVDPDSAQKYIDQANRMYGGNISTIQDVIDAAYAYLDYYQLTIIYVVLIYNLTLLFSYCYSFIYLSSRFCGSLIIINLSIISLLYCNNTILVA